MDKQKQTINLEEVAIRFSGDSGDGMQLTGTLFSDASALFGNDISTFPDYPSEIRAPQGTIGGVSGFQVHVGSKKLHTPGDYCDVLVAMNPAALKANAKWVKPGGTIIVDSDTFNEKGLQRAGYKTDDPIAELKLEDYKTIFAPITTLTKESLKETDLDNKSIVRSKNMFALGMVYYMFERPLQYTEKFFEKKFKSKPRVIDANKKVLRDGYNYTSNIQAIANTYQVSPAKNLKKGLYRNINGNTAAAWGFIAASEKAKLPLFCGSYPITPATDILIELAKRKDLGVKTLQVEDEIAGICTAIGASYAGNFAITTTSGPGLSLKSEAMGLAVMTELPLVIVDVQRGGPSTGLPTKTEQSDLYQALFGRNGECPMVVIAASTPSNCFDYAFMASKIALEHMTPVILLTDGYLANGTEPWLIPSMKDFPEIKPPIVEENTPSYQPYERNPETLARGWAFPGKKGIEHRVGGLEKDYIKGSVSHDPLNHQRMVDVRAEKVERVKNYIPIQEVIGDEEGDLLVVSWGGTYGHVLTAVQNLREKGKSVSLCHLNYLNPLPKNLSEIFKRYKKLLVCELNMGQLANYLRMNFQEYNYLQYNKVQGLPFTVVELEEKFIKILEAK
ncbi:MAG TPA: 2-oxoacid:acceptor oxidoreductase subunit alpha [Tenuifilaceae bacterium]|nr:2-oxoacid:acceptor oxidoreductase subunit alpha [Tenuifilaceae bacterium]HPE17559.1 2-oxoacid:acceptor oxidoreductase subunit alpha [Tenuifilaceae bacterium]HPJ45979.1 2-oxoacid:acceptor oxidoreductase subunit alpha [Tenuifilaceae bacterium]HPQ34323.1 2-oxoacid:acceptor oxidoreductase subunit alpha [Tenuifilaceae bacterium]HRX67991.1 2-oxoacid:acceptor oxidoreductase subunit alpha [Tenuifilaceae bacterium]